MDQMNVTSMTQPLPQPDFEQMRAALESEQRLRAELEDRLRRGRADFQEFTSRIAHDLREPLRIVGVYSMLVASKAGEDEDAKLYLTFLQDAVTRMQTLLSAMIEYASVEAEARRPVAVDLNAATQEAIRRLETRGAQIEYGSLPVVNGDFDLLTKVMRHLIENAIKFAGKTDIKVKIAARHQDQEWVVSVADNGPGIEAQHQKWVFELFRRLHGRDIPGAGLGLAFSKSAVESLGGRMWVESEPGTGSTFLFALPSAD
jgi:signal transduction histidine kinase